MDQIGKLTVLGSGTSQGVPVIGCTCAVCVSQNPKDKRTRTSVYVEIGGVHIQIDAGPDFRSQMLRAQIDRIDAVLLTHEHQDHIAGLDDLRPFIFKSRTSMKICAQQRVLDRLQKVYDYAFTPQPYPGAPSFDLVPITSNVPLEINGIGVKPLEVLHGQLPVLGYQIGNLAYITDVNHIAESVIQSIKGVDTLILDALHHKVHYSHYTLEQAIAVAEMVGAKQTYFIHMSHYMGLHEEINERLPKGMELAFDGLEIPLAYSSKDK